jgi:hypothetical protein
MKRSKPVGVKELKNNLSAYLREVRNGATVMVSDRNSIIAELHEPYRRNTMDSVLDPLLYDWAQARLITLPTAPKAHLPISPVKFRTGAAAELLGSDREELHK